MGEMAGITGTAACTGQPSSPRSPAWSCAALWLNAYSAVRRAAGEPERRAAGSDFSVFIGLIAGGVVYYLLARRSVRAEGDATPVADTPR